MLPALEPKHGREQLLAETGLLEAARNRVDSRDLILEVGVAYDDPAEPERVVALLELRS